MTYDFIGTHIVSDFYGIQTNLTCDTISVLVAYIKESCARNQIKVLKDDHFIFENGGYSLYFLLKESHLSIHTYIEHKAAFIDIFTCGDADTMSVLNDIKAFYNPNEVKTNQIIRGKHSNEQ